MIFTMALKTTDEMVGVEQAGQEWIADIRLMHFSTFIRL